MNVESMAALQALRDEREALSLDIEQRRQRLRAMSARIRELEGQPQAFSKPPGTRTTGRVHGAGDANAETSNGG